MPDPLPGSGTISISEIAEFYGLASENVSLQSLASNLEPEPEANIAMSLFYTSSSCTSFISTSVTSKEPCELEPEDTLYHNGSGAYPVVGDNVFTDSSCEEALTGGQYKMANGGLILILGFEGEVADTGSC